MGAKAKVAKSNRRQFLVALDVPPGVTARAVREMIADVVSYGAQTGDPDDPIFDLDGDSVRVSIVPRTKNAK